MTPTCGYTMITINYTISTSIDVGKDERILILPNESVGVNQYIHTVNILLLFNG